MAAVAPAPAEAMYALTASPSAVPTWVDGTEWISATRLLAVGLYCTMPTPPARLTSALLSTRLLTPRAHSTILPVTFAGSSVLATQAPALAGVAPATPEEAPSTRPEEATSGPTPAPSYRAPLPSVTLFEYRTGWVPAPTV